MGMVFYKMILKGTPFKRSLCINGFWEKMYAYTGHVNGNNNNNL